MPQGNYKTLHLTRQLHFGSMNSTIRYIKKADWVGDRFKEREIANAVRDETVGYDIDIARVIELAKAQKDYH